MRVILFGILSCGAMLLVLKLWYLRDERVFSESCSQLRHASTALPRAFETSMVDELPSPARRYFLYTIEVGTPIRTVATIRMHGEMGLGTRDAPNYQPIQARQILAPPYGFVWQVKSGAGVIRLAGSDGIDTESSWSRFWMLGIIPVVRAGGNPDHRRAAFGRLIGEAVFWTPAALLPREGVTWSAIDENTARVTVEFDGLTQLVDVTVAASGQPTSVVFPRWTNANPDKVFREQPFGGFLHDFQDIEGFRVPTRIEAGNFFGTNEYFPFFEVVVDEIRFDEPADR